jgi:hypothetical protein
MTSAEQHPEAEIHPTVEESMNGRWLTCAAVAATLALAGGAQASVAAAPEPAFSAFALPMTDLDVAPTVALAATTGEPSPATQEFIAGPRLETVRYRPRRYSSRSSRGPSAGSLSQIHAGFFDPDNGSASGLLLGFRGGPQFDGRVAVGGGVDWRFKEERDSEIISEEPLPGGGTREVRRELSRSSTHWFPMMAHLQVSPTGEELGVIPYFGVAGGYQVLFISAEDFQTGEDFEGTFGGWGWQVYGGVGVPLSGRTRLTGELFLNDAEVSRDVDDLLTGQTFHETVDLDGVGMRFGMSWGF